MENEDFSLLYKDSEEKTTPNKEKSPTPTTNLKNDNVVKYYGGTMDHLLQLKSNHTPHGNFNRTHPLLNRRERSFWDWAAPIGKTFLHAAEGWINGGDVNIGLNHIKELFPGLPPIKHLETIGITRDQIPAVQIYLDIEVAQTLFEIFILLKNSPIVIVLIFIAVNIQILTLVMIYIAIRIHLYLKYQSKKKTIVNTNAADGAPEVLALARNSK